MSETNVGKGSLVLTANSAGLDSGLAASQSKIGAWANAVNHQIKHQLAHVHHGIKEGIGEGVGSFLGRVKGGVAGLAAGFGLGALEDAEERIHHMSMVGKSAKGLGVDSAQYMGLSHLFNEVGISGDKMNRVLMNVGHASAQAANGNKELSEAFERIGIDAEELSKKSLDKQMIQLLGTLHKLPEGAQRAEIMMSLFGKQAGKVAPLMSMSSEEIQKWIDKQKSLGNALDEEQMKKIEEAHHASARMKDIWHGFSNQILVAVAPVLTVMGHDLQATMKKIIPVMKEVAVAFTTSWQLVSEILKEVYDYIDEVQANMMDLINEFMGGDKSLTSVAISTEEQVTNVFRGMGIAAAYTWDVIKIGGSIFADVASHIQDGFDLIIIGIEQTLHLLKELPDALKPDWVDEAAQKFTNMANHAGESGEEMRAWAKKTRDEFGKSADQVDKWFAERKLRAKEHGHDLAEAMEQEIEAATRKYAENPSLIRGSKEAYHFEQQWKYSGEMKSDAQKQLGLLGQIRDGINKMNDHKPQEIKAI